MKKIGKNCWKVSICLIYLKKNDLICAFGNENDSDKEMLRKLNRVNDCFMLRRKSLDFVDALFCRVEIENNASNCWLL